MKKTMTYRLVRYAARSGLGEFSLAMGLSVFGGLVESLGVVTIYPFLTLLNKPELIHQQKALKWLYAWGGYANDRKFIFHVGAVSLAMFIVVNVFMFIKQAFLTRFSLTHISRISVSLLRSYLHRPYDYFLKHDSGEISKNVIVHADAVAYGVLLSWITAFSEIFVLIAVGSLLLYVDFKTGLTVIATLGSIVGFIQYFLRARMVRLGQLNDEANGRRVSHCVEALSAVKEIKSAQKEEFFSRWFEKPAVELATAYTRVTTVLILPSYFVQAMAGAFIIGLALFYMSLDRPLSAILPLVSLYAVAGYRLMPSLNRFSAALSQIRQHQSVFESVMQILEESMDAPERLASAVSVKEMALQDLIEIKDVVFSYPSNRLDRPVLNHVDLSIRAGSFVAIVGGSGAGKTTLVDVLLGLFPNYEGAIHVDGQLLTSENRRAWLSHIGYIPQSFFLLNDTIAANIAFGVNAEDIDFEKVRKAVKMAQLEEFLDQSAGGLNAKIGERGVRLSGGQRQRLGIARALYLNPKVLIMDEPTSALDGITEQGIVRTLENLKGNMTIIVVAHRNSTIRNSDTIVVMEEGRVSDKGTYEELIRRNKHFAELMSHPEAKGSSDS